MSRNQSFVDIAAALRETEKIDDVVLALSKREHGKALSERDKTALAFAIDFLEEVASGTSWLTQEKPRIDAKSRRDITSFIKAADSFGASRSKDRFVDDLNAFLSTARNIEVSDDVNVKKLRKFFSNLLGSSLQKIDQAFAANPFIPPNRA